MEYLVSTIIWILATYGMSTIIVNSQLLNPVRNFFSYKSRKYDEKGILTSAVERKFKLPGKLINCIMCTGFWVGVFWSMLYWSPNWGITGDPPLIMSALFSGCLGSATTWIIYLRLYPSMQNK